MHHSHYSVKVNGFVINQYELSPEGWERANMLRDELCRVLINYPGLVVEIYAGQGGFNQVSIEQVVHRMGIVMSPEWYEALTTPDTKDSRDNSSPRPGGGYNNMLGRRNTRPDNYERKHRKYDK